MASILDNPITGILFGGSTYMQNREREKQAGRMMDASTALLGSPGSGIHQEMTGGSGLMGGEITPQQYETQLANKFWGIPHAQKYAGQIQQQQMVNRAAMERQHQQQQFEMGNMTASQRASNAMQQAQFDLSKMNASFDDKVKLTNDMRAAAAPYQKGLDAYDSTRNTLMEAGGAGNLNPYQQIQMLKDLGTMLKPTEQISEGDMADFYRSSGLPGIAKMWEGLITGKGQLGEKQQLQILNTMSAKAQTLERQNAKALQPYQNLASERGWDTRTYRRQASQFAPMGQVETGAQGGSGVGTPGYVPDDGATDDRIPL